MSSKISDNQNNNDRELFSSKLERWLQAPGKKTYGDLESIFGPKTFAVVIVILMMPSALPIPTGGLTNILELFTMIVALQMIFGRKTLWIPKFIKEKSVGETLQKKALPKITSFLRWFEKRSRPRLENILTNEWSVRFAGLVILIFAIGAAVSVPFSGLDTLPSMGAVIVALSILLGDSLLFLVGTAIGTAGIIVIISLGSLILNFFH